MKPPSWRAKIGTLSIMGTSNRMTLVELMESQEKRELKKWFHRWSLEWFGDAANGETS